MKKQSKYVKRLNYFFDHFEMQGGNWPNCIFGEQSTLGLTHHTLSPHDMDICFSFERPLKTWEKIDDFDDQVELVNKSKYAIQLLDEPHEVVKNLHELLWEL